MSDTHVPVSEPQPSRGEEEGPRVSPGTGTARTSHPGKGAGSRTSPRGSSASAPSGRRARAVSPLRPGSGEGAGGRKTTPHALAAQRLLEELVREDLGPHLSRDFVAELYALCVGTDPETAVERDLEAEKERSAHGVDEAQWLAELRRRQGGPGEPEAPGILAGGPFGCTHCALCVLHRQGCRRVRSGEAPEKVPEPTRSPDRLAGWDSASSGWTISPTCSLTLRPAPSLTPSVWRPSWRLLTCPVGCGRGRTRAPRPHRRRLSDVRRRTCDVRRRPWFARERTYPIRRREPSTRRRTGAPQPHLIEGQVWTGPTGRRRNSSALLS
jgi:hypothetical protein